MNNRQTLEHYMGKVWLTRSIAFPSDHTPRQGINVCVEENDDFYAIDYLNLAPDGIYYSKDKPLGKREDDSFRDHIEKLAGVEGKSEAELLQQVCDCYTASGNIAAVAKALGLSKERTRRILITKGAVTNDLISKIAWLYDKGRGKSVPEIADILKISETTVQKNMAYGE